MRRSFFPCFIYKFAVFGSIQPLLLLVERLRFTRRGIYVVRHSLIECECGNSLFFFRSPSKIMPRANQKKKTHNNNNICQFVTQLVAVVVVVATLLRAPPPLHRPTEYGTRQVAKGGGKYSIERIFNGYTPSNYYPVISAVFVCYYIT